MFSSGGFTIVVFSDVLTFEGLRVFAVTFSTRGSPSVFLLHLQIVSNSTPPVKITTTPTGTTVAKE